MSNLLISFLLILCILGGCKQRPKPPAKAVELNKKLEAAAINRQKLKEKYSSMTVSELVKKLEDDGVKNIEPFNSLAYREIVSRGAKIGRELKALVKASNRTSFLTLLALRTSDKEVYFTIDPTLRSKILIDALKESKYFNTWGIPHLYWEEGAKAIIELGDIAIESLEVLLKDKREAPVWGSEEVMEYKKYKYRVCDYAWALIMEIKGEKVKIPEDPTKRDVIISR